MIAGFYSHKSPKVVVIETLNNGNRPEVATVKIINKKDR
jgi:hypothetical protein